jgi:hypothetical protein
MAAATAGPRKQSLLRLVGGVAIERVDAIGAVALTLRRPGTADELTSGASYCEPPPAGRRWPAAGGRLPGEKRPVSVLPPATAAATTKGRAEISARMGRAV